VTDPWLVIAWLVVLHLLAEFLFQGEPQRGRPRAIRLAGHAIVVAICFAPVAVAFGAAGVAVLAVAVVAHVALDGQEAGDRRLPDVVAPGGEGRDEEALELSLGPSWTIWPAASAILVQALHLLTLVVAWRVFLADAGPSRAVADLATSVAGTLGPADFRRAVVTGLVAVGLGVVDIVAAARFVALLLRPWGRPADPADAPPPPDGPAAPAARRWRIRLGPISGSVVADPWSEPAPAARDPGGAVRPAPPASVGRAIGIFERLLITILVLAQAEAAVALVVGVKTVARYRQLDDRSFAEYYLLGTLASVTIGVGAGLVARLALA
jgi:hypothetical protein